MAADSNPARGTCIAVFAAVARRITALLGMAVIIGLLLILIWRVYLHHQSRVPPEEPAVVRLDSRAA
jgi:hypothetical protein